MTPIITPLGDLNIDAKTLKFSSAEGVQIPNSNFFEHIITDNPGLGLIERAKTYIKSNGGSEHYLEFFHDMQKRACALMVQHKKYENLN